MQQHSTIMPGATPRRILVFDVGGSFLKAGLADAGGALLAPARRCPTPSPATPEAVLGQLVALAEGLDGYEALSIGFPGALRRGVALTAPNLGTAHWAGVDVAALAARRFGCPALVANDAKLHGLGIVAGQGVEVVLTLGTGMGFALFQDGAPAPQIELGRHIAAGSQCYDEFVGDAALKAIGETAWRARAREVVARIEALVNFDLLHLGGGNARLLEGETFGPQVRLAANEAGLAGGTVLWCAPARFGFSA